MVLRFQAQSAPIGSAARVRAAPSHPAAFTRPPGFYSSSLRAAARNALRRRRGQARRDHHGTTVALVVRAGTRVHFRDRGRNGRLTRRVDGARTGIEAGGLESDRLALSVFHAGLMRFNDRGDLRLGATTPTFTRPPRACART